MASFDTVNYSLRPSKSIQRQLVFEGAGRILATLAEPDVIYVGMGSIWFTDFQMAYKQLGVKKSISIEGNEIGYRRAQFNAPFATVDVRHGLTGAVLPTLLVSEELKQKPWMIWLDYDYELNESTADDMRVVIEGAPKNSVLVVTFNGLDRRYGKPNERAERLRQVLGSVVPDDLEQRKCKGDEMLATLADLALMRMEAIAQDCARPGGFIPAFRAIYKDGAPMVTVGGVLSGTEHAEEIAALVTRGDWPCTPPALIVAPHLTMKEAAALQAQLPRIDRLTRAAVQALGFDLEDGQAEAFETYYLRYPSFAQIST
jgi:hypothetical protein